MAYGNEAGIVIIDIEQKVCLLNVGSPDLYGAQDPYSRVPRSPKKNTSDILPLMTDKEERQPRSPSIDQVSDNQVLHNTLLLLHLTFCHITRCIPKAWFYL